MKRLLVLVILGALGYLGYRYYTGNRELALPPEISDRMKITQKAGSENDLLNVLGTATTNVVNKSKAIINEVTDGAAEPVINKAVNDLQSRVKELPEEQYQKVKYEFCKDVLVSPSPSGSPQ